MSENVEKYVKRTVAYFRNLVDHALRPYEPSPTHVLKRVLKPFCKNISFVAENGTKNHFKKLVEEISKNCKKYVLA
ncbi:MAG: hypothetical protein ACTSV7_07355 [Candidatus Baldrarchaeia archaeon]